MATERSVSGQTIGLYSLLLAAMFGFFFLGIYVGKNGSSSGSAMQGDQPEESRQAVRSETEPTLPEPGEVGQQLEFYDSLISDRAPVSATPDGASGDRQSPGPAETPEPALSPAVEAEPVSGEPEVTTEEEKVPDPDVAPAFYTVQVAAFSTREEALLVQARLEAKGYPCRIVEPEPSSRFFRVWVGEFTTVGRANRLAGRLKADSFQTYVKRVQPPPRRSP